MVLEWRWCQFMLAWCLDEEDDLFLRLTWCQGGMEMILSTKFDGSTVYSNIQAINIAISWRHLQDFSIDITVKWGPWRPRRKASSWSTPGTRLEKLWKVVKKCQIVAISEKYTLNQQINKISWAFSNPACLLKRRTVSMRRRRSISDVVPPRKSIHMFGLFSCFLLLVVKLKA